MDSFNENDIIPSHISIIIIAAKTAVIWCIALFTRWSLWITSNENSHIPPWIIESCTLLSTTCGVIMTVVTVYKFLFRNKNKG